MVLTYYHKVGAEPIVLDNINKSFFYNLFQKDLI